MLAARAKARRRFRVSRHDVERARSQLQQAPEKTRDQEEHRASRGGDRWITLPKHLASYAGEQAVISQGYVWTHRADRAASWVDERGTRHIPDRGVCLGPVGVLEPPGKVRPGLSGSVGDKTPDFVSGENGTRPIDHLQDCQLGFGTAGGRPRKDGQDAEITRLAQHGLGVKAIARELTARGFTVSYRTVARRLHQEVGPHWASGEISPTIC